MLRGGKHLLFFFPFSVGDSQDGGSFDRTLLQGLQSVVGLVEFENLYFCVEGNGGGEVKKLMGVGSGRVGDRADDALMVEQ